MRFLEIQRRSSDFLNLVGPSPSPRYILPQIPVRYPPVKFPELKKTGPGPVGPDLWGGTVGIVYRVYCAEVV